MKMLALLTMSILAVSCSKEVSSKSGALTVSQPPVIQPPPSPPVVTVPGNSGVLSVNFANHSTVHEDEDLLTSRLFSQAVTISVPPSLDTTYETSLVKPPLSLLVNDQLVCVYYWVSNHYLASNNCYTHLNLLSGDRLSIGNIPPAQTVTLTTQYQK